MASTFCLPSVLVQAVSVCAVCVYKVLNLGAWNQGDVGSVDKIILQVLRVLGPLERATIEGYLYVDL